MMASHSHYIDQDLYDNGFDNIFGNEAEKEHIRSSIMTFRDMGDPIEFINLDTSGRCKAIHFKEEVENPPKRMWKRIRLTGAKAGLKTFAKKTKTFVKKISRKRKHQKGFEEHDQVEHRSSPGEVVDDRTKNGLVETQKNVPHEIEQELQPGETVPDVSSFVGDSINQDESLIQDEGGEPHTEKQTSKELSQAGQVFCDTVRSEEECLASTSSPRRILPEDGVPSEGGEDRATHAACRCEVAASDHEDSPESKNVSKVVPPSLGAAIGQDIQTAEDFLDDMLRTRVSEGNQHLQEVVRPPQQDEMADVSTLLEETLQNVMNEKTESVERTSISLRVALMTAKLRSHITSLGTMLLMRSKNMLIVVKKSVQAILQVTGRMVGRILFLQINRRFKPRRMRFERVVLLGMRFAILRMMMTLQLIGEEGGGCLYLLLLSGILSQMVRLVSVSNKGFARR